MASSPITPLLPLPAGNTLRQLVFDSVVDGSLMLPPPGTPHRRPSALRQALGTTASFAVSGSVHEALFWWVGTCVGGCGGGGCGGWAAIAADGLGAGGAA
jgi:hypothetical protein